MPHSVLLFYYYDIIWWKPVRFFDSFVYVSIQWTIIAYSRFRTTLPHYFFQLSFGFCFAGLFVKVIFQFSILFYLFFFTLCAYMRFGNFHIEKNSQIFRPCIPNREQTMNSLDLLLDSFFAFVRSFSAYVWNKMYTMQLIEQGF